MADHRVEAGGAGNQQPGSAGPEGVLSAVDAAVGDLADSSKRFGALKTLVRSTASQEVRDHLASSDCVATALDILTAGGSVDDLTAIHRAADEGDDEALARRSERRFAAMFLRNLCVNCPANQDAMRAAGFASRFLPSFGGHVGETGDDDRYTRACFQMICNFVAANDANQAALWGIWFPEMFTVLLNASSPAFYVPMIVHYCVVGDLEGRGRELLADAVVWAALLGCVAESLPSIDDAVFEWVFRAYKTLLVGVGVADLFAACGGPFLSTTATAIRLLHGLVEAEIESNAGGRRKNAVNPSGGDDSGVTEEDADLPPAVRSRDDAELPYDLAGIASYPALTFLVCLMGEYRQRDADLFGLLLRVLSALAAAGGSSVREALGELGLVDTAVEFLGVLYKPTTSSVLAPPDIGGGIVKLRRELVRVIANLASGSRANQDRVRDQGGVTLLLNHCRIDGSNPFLREWALFAISNLCEDNPEIQADIEALQPQAPGSNAELAAMGCEIEIDESGNVQLKPMDDTPSGSGLP